MCTAAALTGQPGVVLGVGGPGVFLPLRVPGGQLAASLLLRLLLQEREHALQRPQALSKTEDDLPPLPFRDGVFVDDETGEVVAVGVDHPAAGRTKPASEPWWGYIGGGATQELTRIHEPLPKHFAVPSFPQALPDLTDELQKALAKVELPLITAELQYAALMHALESLYVKGEQPRTATQGSERPDPGR